MSKAYIAAPFSRLTSQVLGRLYGEVNCSTHIERLEKVENVLREAGFQVCLPHRDRGHWGKVYIKPSEIARMCFREVELSDLIVAFPEKSRGVHMELAYAAALKKKLIVFLQPDSDLSIFTYGLNKVTPTIVSVYQDEDDLPPKLKEAISVIDSEESKPTELDAYTMKMIAGTKFACEFKLNE
jgi:hypothetical protein